MSNGDVPSPPPPASSEGPYGDTDPSPPMDPIPQVTQQDYRTGVESDEGCVWDSTFAYVQGDTVIDPVDMVTIWTAVNPVVGVAPVSPAWM